MFGSIGGSEVIFLFILALLIFGPRKLPEIGRTLGKAMADFRRATNDFKTNLEREVQLDTLKDATRSLESIASIARPDALARGAILDLVAPSSPPSSPSPPAPSLPEPTPVAAEPAPSADPTTTDGGTDSIH